MDMPSTPEEAMRMAFEKAAAHVYFLALWVKTGLKINNPISPDDINRALSRTSSQTGVKMSTIHTLYSAAQVFLLNQSADQFSYRRDE